MARHYRFLSFASGVDYKDVDPKLLNRLNRLGMKLGKTITVISGARGLPGHPNTGVSGSHHVPSNNPSGMGEAVDAEIDGKPLGSAVKESTLKRYGLYSGNRPGFYKGKPDPAHIETLERRGQKYSGEPAAAVSSSPSQTMDTTAASPVAGSVPQYLPPGSPPQPEETHPSVYAPGAAGVGGFTPQSAPSTWQELASMPLASPETQLYAQRAGGQ